MALISLKKYAERHGKAHVTVRQMAQRGNFKSVQKIGNTWIIDENEPYPDDKRVKTGLYINWRKPKSRPTNTKPED